MSIYETYKPVNRLARFLGLASVIYTTGRPSQLNVAWKIYKVSLSVLMIASLCWSIWAKFVLYNAQTVTFCILDCFATLSMGFLTVTQILFPIFMFETHLCRILDKFDMIDRRLKCSDDRHGEERRSVLVLLVTGNVVIIAIIVYEVWALIDATGVRVLKYSILRSAHTYVSSMSTCQMIVLLLFIRRRFQMINERIPRSALFCLTAEVSDRQVGMLPISTLSEIHDCLCDVIDLMNTAFGVNILATTICNVFAILETMYVSIIYLANRQSLKGHDNSDYLFGVEVVWSLFFATVLFTTMFVCQLTSTEGNRTAIVIHKLHLESSFVSRNVRKKLDDFTDKITYRPPLLTACGFFTADLSFLSTVTSTLITYLVVVLQFQGLSLNQADTTSNE